MKKNQILILLSLFLFLFLTTSFVFAYHPGTQTAPVAPPPPKDPGSTPIYISIGVIVTIAALSYWKIKYGQDK